MREFFDELTGRSGGETSSLLAEARPAKHGKHLLSQFSHSAAPEDDRRPFWEPRKASPPPDNTGDTIYIWQRGEAPVSIRERGSDAATGAADKLVLKDISAASVSFERSGQHVTLVIAPSTEGAADGARIKLFNLDPSGARGVESVELAGAWTAADIRARVLAAAATDGNDRIRGFTGDAGDDTFSIESAGDAVVEEQGQGAGAVESSVSHFAVGECGKPDPDRGECGECHGERLGQHPDGQCRREPDVRSVGQ